MLVLTNSYRQHSCVSSDSTEGIDQPCQGAPNSGTRWSAVVSGLDPAAIVAGESPLDSRFGYCLKAEASDEPASALQVCSNDH